MLKLNVDRCEREHDEKDKILDEKDKILDFNLVNSLSTSDILTILRLNFYNVNISARIHPPLKQRIPLKS
jgi:hypothetical protein